ncbi:Sec63 Brl domain-containing protein [Kickxella alabastrina]|uniref:Sec63 Brl domain-containing protein n=1 Tax=Kickxella alabastrina TaxID=61397 RepID=UPI002220CE48|nr:Sec63 Brl domain-containing protein [Kickxella alabastrina]KAI7835105.1 Sec63 Brl domain-containing protein [Kickxella alabastrina]KAJ1947083.1 secretory subunit [Kickxella alabastrina]
MGAKYTYDESGVTFFYFALTVLSLLVAPATLFLLAGKKDSDINSKAKTPKVRTRKLKTKSNLPNIKFGLVLLGWFLIFLLSYKVKNTEVAETVRWDPYVILGIDNGESEEVIKKSYRKLSIKWHPDKVTQNLKEKAGEMMAEINRAYKTLTDAEARENYEKYGNPDGMQTQSMGIALPKFLVEAHASPFVLLLYGILFGFVMPFYVGGWWYNSTRYQKDGILNPTMGIFFKNIREHISQRNLVELLTAASEFSEDNLKYRDSEEAALNAIAEKIQLVSRRYAVELFSRSKKFTSQDAWKANVLLHAHFFRVQIDDANLADQQQQMVGTSLLLVHRGLLQIATVHMWYSCSSLLMNISQMLVQGVYSHDAPLIQLPGITWENQPKIFKEKKLYSINQLLRLPAAEQRQALSILSDKQFEEAVQYAKAIPRIEFPRVLLTVVGDKVITKDSFVTLIVKVKVANAQSKIVPRGKDAAVLDIESIADEDTAAIEQFTADHAKVNVKQSPPEALCPYFAGRKDSQWWLSFANYQSGKLVVPPILISNLATERVITVQFQSPPQNGSYRFQLSIKSDSYIGCDLMQDVEMTVVDRSSLPAEPQVDDDISEPEADSIAGQMAQMRGQQAVARGGGNDSSDEE